MSKPIDHSHLSDDALWNKTKIAAQAEKTAALILLAYLHEVELRRLYAKKHYGSLFSFVENELGYSQAETSLRINAMRLIYSVKEAKELVEKSALSLTTASQLQTFFKREEVIFKKRYLPEDKTELVRKCKGKSKRDVDKILLALFLK